MRDVLWVAVQDPVHVRRWISECKVIAALHTTNIQLLETFSGATPQQLATMQQHVITSRGGAWRCTAAILFVLARSLRGIPGAVAHGDGVSLPPAGLETLPSMRVLESLREYGLHCNVPKFKK